MKRKAAAGASGRRESVCAGAPVRTWIMDGYKASMFDEHPLISGRGDLGLAPATMAMLKWIGHLLTDANRVIVVRDRGERVVGFLRFWFSPNANRLTSGGTWVSTSHKRKGLATWMLRCAYFATGARSFWMSPVTHDGIRFADSVKPKMLRLGVKIRCIDA